MRVRPTTLKSYRFFRMNYYVYKLEDLKTKEFYIGCRQCKCSIKDDPYMGSYKSWKPQDKTRLIKTILKSNFRKIQTTRKFEIKIIITVKP